MTRFQRFAARIAAITAACVGCATIQPPAIPPAPTDAYVRAPFDTTWQRVIGFFADSRVPIQTIEKASGLVASTKFRLSDEQAEGWVDCGTAPGGMPALRKLRDNHNPATVLADFNVLVRGVGDSTSVRVNLGVNGEARSPMGIVSLACVTNGKFEQALLRQVSRP